MSTETIVCPSGLSLVIRNMKAKELSLLANGGVVEEEGKAKKKTKGVQRNTLDGVLSGCVLELKDIGPYGAYGAKPGVVESIPWKDVLLCDRFFTLLRVRACTWGAGYEFKARCKDKECERHKKPFIWEEDLDGLDMKELPKKSVDKVKQKDLTFELTLAGKKAKFKLNTGEDEGKGAPEVPKHQLLLAQVAQRLIYVEGQDVTDWPGLLDWVGELDLPEIVEAKEAFDAVDGGVQTNTVVECPSCGLEFDVPIPFDAQDFLLPGKKTSATNPG